MVKYWFISIPAKGSRQTTFNQLLQSIHAQQSNPLLMELLPFVIPDLKVGTLDSLVTLSDELTKVDTLASQFVMKTVDNMKQLLNQDIHQIQETLTVGDN
ncbi:hypothetical protein HMI56_006488 [Coelomomyces lativittatus]|nr:hypothetical protein HMI56_006488 [Coelomomyces lativittatus]